MNYAINFILESGISISLLALIYFLFLRTETFFKLNRYFLLGSIFFSVFLPFLKFQIYSPDPVLLREITVTPYKNLLDAVTVYGKDLSGTIEKAILSKNFLILVYMQGVTFFLYRFLFRIGDLIYIAKTRPAQKCNGFKLVKLEKETSPFSFFNFVFVGKTFQQEEDYNKMISHELEHIKQGHTFDIIVLEILTAFQWFNPFMWLIRNAIRENHEYLADQAVLNSGVKQGLYKKLLLNQFMGYNFEIANNFNYSLIKKRIKMMSKIRSSRFANSKILFGLIVAVALILVFACEQSDSLEVTSLQENQSMTVTVLGEKLKFEGTINSLEKLKNMLSESSDFDILYDSLGNAVFAEMKNDRYRQYPEDQVFYVVENMPVFPGGENALYKFISNTIEYPEIASRNKIEGKVYLSFLVTKDGSVKNAKVIEGVDPALDKEALRVISNLPKWKPGEQRGQVVNVNYTLSINFNLE